MSDRPGPYSVLSRRAFTGLAGKGAAVLALGGAVFAADTRREYIRPPGALPEEDFIVACIRCDRCRKICPDGFISPVPLSESIVKAGTPSLIGYCPRCFKCTLICPTGALQVDR